MILLWLAAAVLAVPAYDFIRRSGLRRLAVRSALRRPTEAVLLLAGSALGTAIIATGFIVGDTFDASNRVFARTDLGALDLRIDADADDLDEITADIEAAVESGELRDVDGLVRLTRSAGTVSAGEPGVELAVETDAAVAELDFGSGRAFGADPAITGLVDAGPTPAPGGAVASEVLADRLGLEVGDEVSLFLYGQTVPLEVDRILPRVGFGGFMDLYLAPGTLDELARGAAGRAPIEDLWLSLSGGVFDTADATGPETDLERMLAGYPNVEVRTIKENLLDNAAQSGQLMRQIFGTVGAFSVIVGILLLVNLIVMLSEERKSELGILRAMGVRRIDLVRVFGMEGALYAAGAVLAGPLLGVAVARVMVVMVASFFAEPGSEFQLTFAVTTTSLQAAVAIGLLITLATVFGTAVRVSRLNIIRAIREAAEPPRTTVGRASWIGLVLGGGIGGLMIFAGLVGGAPVPSVIGIPLVAFATMPVLTKVLGPTVGLVIPGAVALVWGVTVFTIVPAALGGTGFEVFVVQGMVLVAAAVALASAADRFWHWVTSRAPLGQRLAMAEPLAERGRTAILLAMFSLILFTMTLAAVTGQTLAAQIDGLADDAAGGWDLVVDSNGANPLPTGDLRRHGDVAAAAPMTRAFPEFEVPFDDPDRWPATGLTDAFLDVDPPALSARAEGFGSDADAWAALFGDPSAAIVSESLLQSFGPGGGGGSISVGDRFTMSEPTRRTQVELVAIGLVDSDFIGSGLFVSHDVLSSVSGELAVPSRHFAALTDGAAAGAASARLNGEFFEFGVDARDFRHDVDEVFSAQLGLTRVMIGYLGMGIVIGVAGLGVVMLRAARQRRREIGVLRALGVGAMTIRRAFLGEAAFVALQGVVIGIVLGLVTSNQLITQADWLGEGTPFRAPWPLVAAILVIPTLASLAASLIPARQASRVAPAAALRIAD